MIEDNGRSDRAIDPITPCFIASDFEASIRARLDSGVSFDANNASNAFLNSSSTVSFVGEGFVLSRVEDEDDGADDSARATVSEESESPLLERD